jgi:bis(5'-adenosyl)-triphosphatase
MRFRMNYLFGPYALHSSQVFFESPLSIGIVNLKPIVPGHVLILPKRVESRVMKLTQEEYTDLFYTARLVAPKIEAHYGANAMNIAIQDGAAAGQSVPHVHIHILPRKEGDFVRNDDVYEELEKQHLQEVFRDERKARTKEEMEAECTALRKLFYDDESSSLLLG